jgi:hypothetical protein
LELLPDYQRQEFIPIYNEKMSLLAIANYNLASQYEFLDNFEPAIIYYELALSLVSNGSKDSSPLMKEFQQSLKQVKIRAAAYEMKRPDKTFTNLNKGRRESETAISDNAAQAMCRIIKANSNNTRKTLRRP